MKQLFFYIGFIIALHSYSSSLYAESINKKKSNLQISQLKQSRKYANPIVIATHRAEKIRDKYGALHPKYAAELNRLGVAYVSERRPEEAEAFFKRAIAILEKAEGKGRDSLGVSKNIILFSPLDNLGELYMNSGRNAEAEILLNRSISIKERVLGKDHHRLNYSLRSLGRILLNRGYYTKAEKVFLRVIKISEKKYGKNDANLSNNLTFLGNSYRLKGEYAKAEPLIKRALKISEKK